MLSVDVENIELLVMEDQIHLTITGTICGVFFGVLCWFYSSQDASIAEQVDLKLSGIRVDSIDMDQGISIYKKEDWTTPRTGVVCLVVAYVAYVYQLINHLYFDHIEAMLRKVTGLKSGEEKSPRRLVQLGPHDSYRTLIFSILSCTVTLAIIWLIKITPFEKLYKSSPLCKLVKILINSPDLDLEEEYTIKKGSPEETARHQQILNTCIELEKRMCHLEQCLAPLTRSLQNLSEAIDSRNEHQAMDQSHITDLPEADDDRKDRSLDSTTATSDSQVADLADFGVEAHADSKVTKNLDFQGGEPIYQVTNRLENHFPNYEVGQKP